MQEPDVDEAGALEGERLVGARRGETGQLGLGRQVVIGVEEEAPPATPEVAAFMKTDEVIRAADGKNMVSRG